MQKTNLLCQHIMEASTYITIHYRNGIHASSRCMDSVQPQTPSVRMECILAVTPVFPKKTKCKPICMPGSSFMHIVTYKWIQKQNHIRKRENYQRFTLYLGNEGIKLHRQSTGGCVRLAPATSSTNSRVASSFGGTLFIARVSTCRTQQVWGKYECKGFIVDWAVSI
jgi:hypothetical protein